MAGRKRKVWQRGFTLIELIVVVAIIATLAVMAVPRFNQAMENARGARILADLRTIDSAIIAAQVSGVPNPTMSGEDGTSLVPAFLLYVPIPPQGTARFSAGGTLTVPNNASAVYKIVSNRAVVGGANYRAEELMIVTTAQTY